MGLWGFDEQIVNGVAFHHMPQRCEDTSGAVLTAIHIANALEHESGVGKFRSSGKIDTEYINQLDQSDWFFRWRKLAM